MKLSKKLRFLFSLTVLLISLFMGTIAVSADTLSDYEEETTTLSEEDAQTYANGKINMSTAKSLVEQYASAISQIASCSTEELEYIADSMSYQTDIYSSFLSVLGDDTCGALTSYDNVVVTETDSENAVDIVTDMHFEQKELKMTLHVTCFDTIGTQVTSTEFSLADSGEETLGAKMATAFSNTLMGMGVVFLVLIFICLIISCFKFIPQITEKFENRKNGKTEVAATAPIAESVASPVITEEDNTELIAVIAAAIAASEQTSTDSFVVRSIRRHI
jgi:sodium pump decarboxylase gamma subunit